VQTPSDSISVITRDDITRAEQELETAIAQWGNAGRISVSTEKLVEEELRAKNVNQEWQKIEQSHLPIDELEQFENESCTVRRDVRRLSRQLVLNRLMNYFWGYSAVLQRVLVLPDEKLWMVSLFHGAWGLFLAGLLCIVFGFGILTFGILGLVGYLLTFLGSFRQLLKAAGGRLESIRADHKNRISMLRIKINEARTEFIKLRSLCKELHQGLSLRQELENTELQLAKLRENVAAQAAYKRALEQLNRLKDILGKERYELVSSDWRSLRGIPFEDFLAQIFRSLGYQVKKTKVTGDQGVDLIVTRSDKQIAVQAKGYDGNVGNDSVQQAHTGMVFYNCNECIVITNSRFTRAAEELALSVRCRLIDGDQIVALINGRLL
jgi:HJR/Mrr/RecB family endonuclease